MSLKSFVEVKNKGVHAGDILGYWELAPGDTAKPLLCPRFNDKSVHIFGTFGGATAKMQITNDPDLGNFEDAYDYEGTVISQSAARAPWVILPNVFAIKPVLTGGSGSLIKVVITGRGDA